MNRFYVYVLWDNKVPFYVGKGLGNRMYQHIKDSTSSRYLKLRSVHMKIKQMIRCNRLITYEQIWCCNEKQAFEIEKLLIKQYGRKDLKLGTLCNLTDGGEGVSNQSLSTIVKRTKHHIGAKRSELSRYNMSMAQLNRRQLGYSASIYTRNKQRLNRIGYKHSTEVRQKLTQSHSRQIQQFDLSGEFIQTFESLKSAAEYVGLKNHTPISKSCKFPMKYTAAGYYWIYSNDNHRIHYSVEQYDMNGNYITSFDNVNECAKRFNCSPSGIIRCCNNLLLSYIGYKWKRVNKQYNVRKNSQKIAQYTLEDQLITIHDSVFVAIASVNKTDVTTIYKCCKGKQQQSHGFKWRYANT